MSVGLTFHIMSSFSEKREIVGVNGAKCIKRHTSVRKFGTFGTVSKSNL